VGEVWKVLLTDLAPIQQTITNTPGFGSGGVASWSKFAVRTLLSKIQPDTLRVGVQATKLLFCPTTVCDMNKRTTFVKLGGKNRDKLSHQDSFDYVKK